MTGKEKWNFSILKLQSMSVCCSILSQFVLDLSLCEFESSYHLFLSPQTQALMLILIAD
jgi:hypothetical protein